MIRVFSPTRPVRPLFRGPAFQARLAELADGDDLPVSDLGHYRGRSIAPAVAAVDLITVVIIAPSVAWALARSSSV